MKLRLNNKGNTLGIVLIGIFILSILGTLILGITSTNLNMKLVDKKTEMTFYYAEKAMDELYAAIGTEVMNCTKEAYSEVLENYIKADGTPLDSTEANKRFKELLIKGDTTVGISGITSLYKDGSIVSSTDNIGEMFARFNTNGYITSVPSYTITIFSPSSEATSIVYKKASGIEVAPTEMNAINLVEIIEIKNIGIECVSNNGYYSSIVTDFEIKIPNINMDFSDSKTEGNIEELAQYSLIAEGSNTIYSSDADRVKPAIQIGNGTNASTVVIKGNVYANGTAYSQNAAGIKTFVRNNNSIEVTTGSSVTFQSKIVNCINNFLLTDAKAFMGNYTGTDSVDAIDALQFYSGNIETKGNTGSTLQITGNCIVEDDLEVNGKESDITIKGNYFGYGFRNVTGSRVEADTDEITGFLSSTATATEHAQSSAIIINETGANVNMIGLNKLVLAGRAYIDLDSSGTNASYMTGESVSFKGNQHMYLADTELSGSAVAGQNPIRYAVLKTLGGYTDGTDITYSSIGLNTSTDNQVVAKKIDEDVYFYVKNKNPITQTQYFKSTFKNNATKRQNMVNNITSMNIKNVVFSNSLKSYTVGTIAQVESGSLKVPAGNELIAGANGIPENSTVTDMGFYDILDDIEGRINHLVPSLKDVSTESILGVSQIMEAPTISSKSPFEYYVDQDYINGISGRKEVQNIEETAAIDGLTTAEASMVASRICTILGITDTSTINVGYIVSNETGIGGSVINLDAGVIISKSPFTVSKDFTGLIICNETMYISGNVSISSAKELVEYMFEAIPDLTEALNEDLLPRGADETGTIVDADSLTYTELVEKKNWRKNFK